MAVKSLDINKEFAIHSRRSLKSGFATMYDNSAEIYSTLNVVHDIYAQMNHQIGWVDKLKPSTFPDDSSIALMSSTYSTIFPLKHIQAFYDFLKENIFDAESSLELGQNTTKNLLNSSSTSSSDINKSNKTYFNMLKANTEPFVQSLMHSDFEDGIVSEIAQQVAKYIEENRFVTYSWLNYLYSQYGDNPIIIAALLRVIAQIDINNEEDCLLPLVVSGLNHKSSATQEAAIMVIENWRTSNCLKALENINFSSEWMKRYATDVINELKEELS